MGKNTLFDLVGPFNNVNKAYLRHTFHFSSPATTTVTTTATTMTTTPKQAMGECMYHSNCGTTQACRLAPGSFHVRKCIDLCFSDNCNQDVNNARDVNADTPLHIAAEKNRVALAKLLIENSAYVNSKNVYGYTALHEAAYKNNVGVARLLIENSANVNSQQYQGYTALHLAAGENNVDMANLLIENSANVDITDRHGETALHFAARENSADVAKILIDILYNKCA